MAELDTKTKLVERSQSEAFAVPFLKLLQVLVKITDEGMNVRQYDVEDSLNVPLCSTFDRAVFSKSTFDSDRGWGTFQCTSYRNFPQTNHGP